MALARHVDQVSSDLNPGHDEPQGKAENKIEYRLHAADHRLALNPESRDLGVKSRSNYPGDHSLAARVEPAGTNALFGDFDGTVGDRFNNIHTATTKGYLETASPGGKPTGQESYKGRSSSMLAARSE